MKKIDYNHFYEIANKIIETTEFQQLKKYNHHANISVYEHSINVAKRCYEGIACKKNQDIESIIRGALLHDYYFYDWHDKNKGFRFHGYKHPKIALENARKLYKLNAKEIDMITCHMWPLTFFHFPKYKEGWRLVMNDKICAVKEYLKKS